MIFTKVHPQSVPTSYHVPSSMGLSCPARGDGPSPWLMVYMHGASRQGPEVGAYCRNNCLRSTARTLGWLCSL